MSRLARVDCECDTPLGAFFAVGLVLLMSTMYGCGSNQDHAVEQLREKFLLPGEPVSAQSIQEALESLSTADPSGGAIVVVGRIFAKELDGWAGERYLPRLKELYCLDADQLPFDFYELVASIAPRGFFSCSPIGDNNFSVAGVRKAIPVAGEVYKLFNQPNRLQVRYPDCGHDFPQSIREESYQFLDSVLKISGSP